MKMEIETKIPISKDKAEAIIYKVMLTGNPLFDHLCIKRKNDTYYSKYSSKEDRDKANEPLLRTRSELRVSIKCLQAEEFMQSFFNKDLDKFKGMLDTDVTLSGYPCKEKEFFTIKRKNLIDDVEHNEEEEFPCKSDSIKAFAEVAGYKEFLTKEKVCVSFSMEENLNVDIVNVNNKVFYFECECLDDNAAKALIKLTHAVESFGLDMMNKDSRSWPEIIKSLENK